MAASSDGRDQDGAEELLQRLRLETAFYAFYSDPAIQSETAVDRRNRVQQRLILASDINCGIFTDRLYKIQGSGNFALGALATMMGGAGAIVTDVDSARILSGLSSITSGVRAEANEDFFRKQWIEALAKAIDNERNRMREQIDAHKGDTIAEYPVEEAVAEVLRYNDACSVVSALKEVNRAVTIADDPAGLRAFRESYERAGFQAQFSATVTSEDQKSSSRLRPVTSATASVALSEIARDVADVRAQGRVSKLALAKDLPAAEADAAAGKIDAVVKRLQDGDSPGEDLLAYAQQLQTQKVAYEALALALAKADTAEKRRETEQLMRANDAASEIFRRAAESAIAAAAARIGEITRDSAVAAPPQPPANTPQTGAN